MRVMVTGGAGFIGSALVRHLVIEKGYRVLTVDKLTYAGNLASLREVRTRSGHLFCQADICDRHAMSEAMQAFRPNLIMHLAAESHVDRSISGAEAFVQTNIFGTFSLLEVTRHYLASLPARDRRAFRFVHVSTDEVYGSLGPEGAFTECSPYSPNSPYSASKAAADHLVRAWAATYDLPVIVATASNNYGPRQFPEKLIPLTILNAIEGKPIPVYGRGDNVRDWLHVEDHVRALELIGTRGRKGESYNIGGGAERRNLDVVTAVCSLLDRLRPAAGPHADLISFVPDRPGHDRRYALDSTRLRSELGWVPEQTFESGLERTVAWYLRNRWWWKDLRTRYSGERLGLPSGAAVRDAELICASS